MPNLRQNDKLNRKVDPEMLQYLHRGSRRERRTVFPQRPLSSKIIGRQAYPDSLSRFPHKGETMSLKGGPLFFKGPTPTFKKPGASNKPESSKRVRVKGSSDAQLETFRYISSPSGEEREGPPLAEEAQSLLHQFLSNSKRLEKQVDKVELRLEASQPQKVTADGSFKPHENHNPLKRTADGNPKQNRSHVLPERTTDGKVKDERGASKPCKQKDQDVGKISKTPTPISTKEKSQQLSKGAVQQRTNAQLAGRKVGVESFDGVKNNTSDLFTLNTSRSQSDVRMPGADERGLKTQHKADTSDKSSHARKFTQSHSSSSVVKNQKSTISQPSVSFQKTSPLSQQRQPVTKEGSRTSSFPPLSKLSKPTNIIPILKSSTTTNDKRLERPEDDMGPKRPRRTTAPVNYCLKKKLHSFEKEESDVEPVYNRQTKANPPTTKPPPSLPIQTPANPKIRILHSSDTGHIQQEYLRVPVVQHFDKVAHVPYSNKRSREKIIQSYKDGKKENLANRNGVVFHADFDNEEIESIFYIISTFNPHERNVNPVDMVIQDQITQAIRNLDDNVKLVADRINKIRDLHDILSKHTSDIKSVLLGAMEGDDSLPRGDSEKAAKLMNWNVTVLESENENKTSSLVAAVRARSEEDISKLADQLSKTVPLRLRSPRSVEKFLIDAEDGCLATLPSALRAFTRRQSIPNAHSVARPSTLVPSSRELGHQPYRSVYATVDQKIRDQGMRKQMSWKGASNDVIVSTWSPDGTRFAAGATAQCDSHNMVYNRGNNLILGDLVSNQLRELPDHKVPRPPPANVMTDPELYMSVSAVKWSSSGDRLFTASYDKTVKVWDASSHARTRCIQTLPHQAKVEVMALSQYHTSLVAVGQDSSYQAFGLWNLAETFGSVSSGYTGLDLTNPRSGGKIELVPSSLMWGTSPGAKNYLVGGMSSNKADDRGDPSRNGFLAMWHVYESGVKQVKVMPNAQNVFDVVWHPTLPYFAAGSSVPLSPRSKGLGATARSLVRIYEPHAGRMLTEYECPAIDMNDVSFCPTNDNYISAGCTDGVTYVWDYRMGDTILHKLSHGDPLSELDADLTREQADVGVRVALWGNTTDRFFTGSSDGVLKSWDILRAPEDAHIQDVVSLDSEIMSGSFSPDKSNILLGDSSGGVHVLSAAPFSSNLASKTFDFEHAYKEDDDVMDEDEQDKGVRAANAYLSTGELVRNPVYGIGKGPNYSGPYAAWARPEGTDPFKLAQTPFKSDIQMRPLPVNKKPIRANGISLFKIKGSRIQKPQVFKPKKRKREEYEGREVIVISSDEEDHGQMLQQPRRSQEIFDSGDEAVESLRQRLEEDYWWPMNVDANIKEQET